MKVIFKYDAPEPGHCFSKGVPKSWTPLHVAYQRGKICIWAEVDPNFEGTKRINLVTIATGAATMEMIYIGTVHTQVAGIDLVWHVLYENIEGRTKA